MSWPALHRYVSAPLLLEGKKFDLRVYMLIANTSPFVVLYRKGYVRLCLGDYRSDTDALSAHLTNQVFNLHAALNYVRPSFYGGCDSVTEWSYGAGFAINRSPVQIPSQADRLPAPSGDNYVIFNG